jgi:hypothetical protein
MKPKFFCRHGQVESGDFLSAAGIAACTEVRELLRDVCDFTTVLTSPAERCRETAEILTAGKSDVVFVPHAELRTFADYRSFVNTAPCTGDEPPRYNFSNWPTVVGLYQEYMPELVVGHDCVPVILAFKVLERRGVRIDWLHQPPELTNLAMGCGI